MANATSSAVTRPQLVGGTAIPHRSNGTVKDAHDETGAGKANMPWPALAATLRAQSPGSGLPDPMAIGKVHGPLARP
jgi:hypothetical protein